MSVPMSACSAPEVLVKDLFLDQQELKGIVAQLPNLSENADQVRCSIEATPDLERRIQDCLGLKSPSHIDHTPSATVSMPARITVGGIKEHKDTFGSGQVVDGHIAVLYLYGSGTLKLVEDGPEDRSDHFRPVWEHSIEIKAGRLVCWPNASYTHRVDDADAPDVRAMVGPMGVSPSGHLQASGVADMLAVYGTRLLCRVA